MIFLNAMIYDTLSAHNLPILNTCHEKKNRACLNYYNQFVRNTIVRNVPGRIPYQ